MNLWRLTWKAFVIQTLPVILKNVLSEILPCERKLSLKLKVLIFITQIKVCMYMMNVLLKIPNIACYSWPRGLQDSIGTLVVDMTDCYFFLYSVSRCLIMNWSSSKLDAQFQIAQHAGGDMDQAIGFTSYGCCCGSTNQNWGIKLSWRKKNYYFCYFWTNFSDEMSEEKKIEKENYVLDTSFTLTFWVELKFFKSDSYFWLFWIFWLLWPQYG